MQGFGGGYAGHPGEDMQATHRPRGPGADDIETGRDDAETGRDDAAHWAQGRDDTKTVRDDTAWMAEIQVLLA